MYSVVQEVLSTTQRAYNAGVDKTENSCGTAIPSTASVLAYCSYVLALSASTFSYVRYQ